MLKRRDRLKGIMPLRSRLLFLWWRATAIGRSETMQQHRPTFSQDSFTSRRRPRALVEMPGLATTWRLWLFRLAVRVRDPMACAGMMF